MSSSALTIGQSALAATDLKRLLDRVPLVAALTLTAVRGGTEAFAASVHARRPHPGAQHTAARMRQLLTGADWSPVLVQDPFGFRCLPQVHGAALDSWSALDAVLGVELNASVENPLLDLDPDQPGREDYLHHGDSTWPPWRWRWTSSGSRCSARSPWPPPASASWSNPHSRAACRPSWPWPRTAAAAS
ncbi:aromatic amino acid lyase [Streptacidiphilus monticola]